MPQFPKVGSRFEGRFIIDELVAVGGFSRIYRARQEGLDRTVALKILKPVEADGGALAPGRLDEWKRRFEREARLVSRLRDPHTVILHDYGRSADNHWYIVFEFIDGHTLSEVCLRGAIAPERAVSILRQILQSLEEAHHQQVLHRDIKPANIMLYEHLGRADRVKVLDFGIAHGVDRDPDVTVEDLTRDGHILGTPRYMAPEQLRQEPLSAATDIYSLGLVAWEMLTGEPAIAGTDTMSVVSRQVDRRALRLPDELDIPAWLRSVVERMVARSPDDRFQSCAEVYRALDEQVVVADAAPEQTSHTVELVDPNVDGVEETFGPGAASDQSVEAAVASLTAARGTARTRPRSRRTPELDLRPEPATSDEDDRDDEHRNDDKKDDKDEVQQKVSELTMMGVEQMLDRGERGEDRRRRWGCWATLIVVLLGIAGGGYFMYRHAGSLAQVPDKATELAKKWLVHPAEDAMAPDGDRYSFDGLQLVIEGAGWEPQGKPEEIVEPSRRELTQRYRLEEHRISAVFHDLQERSEVRDLLERVEPPSRAVMFDTKAVVLTPETDADADAVEGLEMLLEAYRDEVEKQSR